MSRHPRWQVPFTHDTPAAQRANFAEVTGQLGVEGGQQAANTEVELVDDEGNVLQKVKTTRSGQYRFKNVKGGKYKVRVKRKGFRAQEAAVEAEAAKPASKADMMLEFE